MPRLSFVIIFPYFLVRCGTFFLISNPPQKQKHPVYLKTGHLFRKFTSNYLIYPVQCFLAELTLTTRHFPPLDMIKFAVFIGIKIGVIRSYHLAFSVHVVILVSGFDLM